MNTREVGSCHEKEAAAFLKKHGYEILEYNYHDRFGEIDLIALDQGYLVFIEVKYRKNCIKGTPEEAVNQRKQQKIRNTARYYLYSHQIREDRPCRFDVVSILGTEIHLIRDAF